MIHRASSPLPFVTTSLRHHFPSSPLPFVTTPLHHHFPSSPLPFVTTPLHHHFPSSPLPFVTTSLLHHFPSSPLPFVTTPLHHHFPSSPLPFVTTPLHHHFPSSPLPFVITTLPPCNVLYWTTTLHHFLFVRNSEVSTSQLPLINTHTQSHTPFQRNICTKIHSTCSPPLSTTRLQSAHLAATCDALSAATMELRPNQSNHPINLLVFIGI